MHPSAVDEAAIRATVPADEGRVAQESAMDSGHKLLAVAVAALLLGDVAAASAGVSKHKRHHAYHPAITDRGPAYHSSSEPARMIEVRPGVFISSYDCITDDGYGRWLPCSFGAGRSR